MWQLDWVDVGKLLAAVIAGGIIGLERETHDKPAGFRTNILICLGAALFTVMSLRIPEGFNNTERTRIAAQIVTGVGFLGAGAIIQFRGNVIGLTTAATIWLVASVGMAFGAGHFLLGSVVTILATAVLFALESIEVLIARWRTVATFELELSPAEDATDVALRAVRAARVGVKNWSVSRTGESVTGRLTVVGPAQRLEALEHTFLQHAAIRAIKRL
jgi:putative Mg2+ transporter-C (MgtC) family protein